MYGSFSTAATRTDVAPLCSSHVSMAQELQGTEELHALLKPTTISTLPVVAEQHCRDAQESLARELGKQSSTCTSAQQNQVSPATYHP